MKAQSREPRAPFGYARTFKPETPPPDHEVFRKELPKHGVNFCDSYIDTMQKKGDFPAFEYLSPRKRFLRYATLQAFKAISGARLKWRDWAKAKRPLSEVQDWITEQTAKKSRTAKRKGGKS